MNFFTVRDPYAHDLEDQKGDRQAAHKPRRHPRSRHGEVEGLENGRGKDRGTREIGIGSAACMRSFRIDQRRTSRLSSTLHLPFRRRQRAKDGEVDFVRPLCLTTWSHGLFCSLAGARLLMLNRCICRDARSAILSAEMRRGENPPFKTAPLTCPMQYAPSLVQRICCLLTMRWLTNWFTADSAMLLLIGKPLRCRMP